jgi:raffinose/stachyose/melibiose transport system permease protein
MTIKSTFFRKNKRKIFDTAIMSLMALIVIFPMFLIVRRSFTIRGFGNYAAVLEGGILTNVKNSFIISIGTIIVVLLLICPAAYAFSKFNFRYKNLLYYAAILGMMIPSVVLLVPILVLGKSLNLMNNLFGVILPLSALRAPFMLLILKNSIDDHPVELYESAFVDGCSRLRMLFSIALPLSKPTLLVVTIFVFMDSWNEFFLPLALLRSPDKMTITVVPTRFFEEFGADQPKIFAASVLIVQPVIIVYLLLQKYFEMGFTTGAVKG